MIFILFILSSWCYAETEINIIGVGDIMLGTDHPSPAFLPPNEGRDLLKAVNSILQNADVTFGNLEGPILNEGSTAKNCAKCFSFKMPEYLAQHLVTAGFDVLSLANNHVSDFGQKGRDNTLRVLQSLGIHAAGLMNIPSVSFEKNGLRYGFAAFAPNLGTVDLRDIPQAQRIVQQLAQNNDIVIVSFHGGAEGSSHQQVTRQTEIFYGENRGNVYEFAHAVIDAGADVVFGHGPHVTRAIEVYNNRFIAYSLGNFCTYGRFSLAGPTGVAPIIQVTMEQSGQFKRAKIISTRQLKSPGNVFIDPDQQALHYIRNLTKTDFPQLNLNISPEGIVTLP
jgi:2',3'-cyclic-nucleotide 2'-phosphodiesterase (5'-nucleotidase family)